MQLIPIHLTPSRAHALLAGFDRPEASPDTAWRSVPEGWEPLGYQLVDEAYRRTVDSRTDGENALGWSLACGLTERLPTAAAQADPAALVEAVVWVLGCLNGTIEA